MKNKLSICALIALTVVAVAAAATVVGLTVANLPEKGEWIPTGINVAKPAHVQGFDLLPVNGTLIIKQRIGTSTTNTVYSGTATNGAINHAISGTYYVVAGDTLIREGTITNGSVRVLLEGD